MIEEKRVEDSRVETVHIIRPNHLNAAGRLFGGMLMQWLDETQGLPWLPGIMASRLPVSIVSNMINAEARRTTGVTDARTTTINDVKGDYTIRFAVYVGADSTEVTSGIN